MPFSFYTGGGAAPRRPCVFGMREGAGGAAAFGGRGAGGPRLSLSKNLWRMEDRGPFRL